jgi:glyoxylase-like metal-dependent hydrolase (beta-lactamase superfamily II)
VPPILETLADGFDKNLCYVFGCSRTRQGALVDAGIPNDLVFAAFEDHGLRPVALLVTHAHGDHLSEAPGFVRRAHPRVYAFDPDVRGRLGLAAGDFQALSDGDEIALGDLRLEALHTPGHSPDSACFRSGRILFTGDTLFVGRTGRTLGPGASTRELYRSVARLKRLPPETVICPGHDYGDQPTSTLGREIERSPFLQAGTEEEFVRVMERFERDRRRG